MIDLQGLFNCLRPEPVDENGAFSEQDLINVPECSFCINPATHSVEFKEKGRLRHLYSCDECHEMEGQWDGREILNVTKL